MFSKLRYYYDHHPLYFTLSVAFLIRILAAFFSKGYAFHDDHFCVIRVAQDWVYQLPHWLDPDTPPLHSMLYAGINYGIFYTSELVGITDSQTKMLVVRIIHALYSLLIVYYGYKITAHLSDKKTAFIVGMILSILWYLPFMSVRNLVEIVCIPPVLAGYYHMIKYPEKTKSWWVAGLLFGLSFAMRYHTILFAGGLGLVLLFKKLWKESALFTIAYLIAAFLGVGLIDMIFYKYPFHSLVEYYEYNSAHAYSYITSSYYKFLLTLFGFLVPPVSVLLLIGFTRSYKIEPLMFSSAIAFFVFHSYFPNKQERFIFPLIPIIIILGTIGWYKYYYPKSFWVKRKYLHRGMWSFFWFANMLVALALAFTYSKKGRIEPLSYISKQKNVDAVIVESSRGQAKMPPVFYLEKVGAISYEYQNDPNYAWNEFKMGRKDLPQNFIFTYTLGQENSISDLKKEINTQGTYPDYIVFTGRENIKERIIRVENGFNTSLTLLKEIKSSLYDRILNNLNPRVHPDEYTYIYKFEQ